MSAMKRILMMVRMMMATALVLLAACLARVNLHSLGQWAGQCACCRLAQGTAVPRTLGVHGDVRRTLLGPRPCAPHRFLPIVM